MSDHKGGDHLLAPVQGQGLGLVRGRGVCYNRQEQDEGKGVYMSEHEEGEAPR